MRAYACAHHGRTRLPPLDRGIDLRFQDRPECLSQTWLRKTAPTPKQPLYVVRSGTPSHRLEDAHQAIATAGMRHFGGREHAVSQLLVREVGELKRQLAPRDDLDDPAAARVDVVIRPQVLGYVDGQRLKQQLALLAAQSRRPLPPLCRPPTQQTSRPAIPPHRT